MVKVICALYIDRKIRRYESSYRRIFLCARARVEISSFAVQTRYSDEQKLYDESA